MEERLFEPVGLRQSGVARISQPRDKARVAEVVSLVSLNSRTREPSFVSSDSGRNYGAAGIAPVSTLAKGTRRGGRRRWLPIEFYTGIGDIVANEKSVLAEVASDRRSEAQVSGRGR